MSGIEILDAGTVVIGTGSAGYAAATRLADLGVDVVMVTDKVGAGTSRNAGSDKQTYYKLTLAGGEPDSVGDLAETLFSGGAMDGDIALAEAAGSARAFLHLAEAGVPFPVDAAGQYIGYRTDHDPCRRATSAGPYTSRMMVERLEARARAAGIDVRAGLRLLDLIVADGAVAGLLCLRTDAPWRPGEPPPFVAIRADSVIQATGGPAGMYADSVFPHGQWGATGAALRAGAPGRNLTEWQFGMASIHPRWNVSGSYMQVVPRFISTATDGTDPREFLTEALPDPTHAAFLTFLKGYQWPFDVRKAKDGSSIIDLLVHRETVLRGRRVLLDFTTDSTGWNPDALPAEARDYLAAAGALTGRPIDRLLALNPPAYDLYRERNPGIDLAVQPLEIAVCAQHNNGGLAIDDWWRTPLPGLFAIGEAAGAHGVYRPGGAALNSGQVGAMRAATHVAARRGGPRSDDAAFAAALAGPLTEARDLLGEATASASGEDNTAELLAEVTELMSRCAGVVRSRASIDHALGRVTELLADLPRTVRSSTSRRSIDRVFLLRDILTAQRVYLWSMANYLERGGHSRGAVLYTDPNGELPQVPGLPEDYRFTADGGALDEWVQEVSLVEGECRATWRPVRPIPHEPEFFETVWREYRESGNIPS